MKILIYLELKIEILSFGFTTQNFKLQTKLGKKRANVL